MVIAPVTSQEVVAVPICPLNNVPPGPWTDRSGREPGEKPRPITLTLCPALTSPERCRMDAAGQDGDCLTKVVRRTRAPVDGNRNTACDCCLCDRERGSRGSRGPALLS